MGANTDSGGESFPDHVTVESIDGMLAVMVGYAESELSGDWLYQPMVWSDGTYKLVFEHRCNRPEDIDKSAVQAEHADDTSSDIDVDREISWAERIKYHWEWDYIAYELVSQKSLTPHSNQSVIHRNRRLASVDFPVTQLKPFDVRDLVE